MSLIDAEYEPPYNLDFSERQLRDFIDLRPSFPSFPNHNQAVERQIKIVTDASKHVVGDESRDGLIRACLMSRKQLPHVESKKDFMNLLNN